MRNEDGTLNWRLIDRVILYVLVFAVCVLALSAAFGQKRVSDAAGRSSRALCTLKAQDVKRLNDTRDYLKKHPDGIPGISRTDLLRAIDGLKAQVRGLEDVRCS